jgi:lipopolysaccharide export system protein LptA
MNLKQRLPTLLLLCALTGPAAALETDTDQPIEIEADRMMLNEQTGISSYSGKVSLTQGSLNISAEQLTISTADGVLQQMKITGIPGKPAIFRQQTAAGEEALGQALNIDYHAQESRLILTGQAEMRQGGNHIKSERIDYNTETNSLIAGQAASKTDTTAKPAAGERVKIVINPKTQPAK